MADLNIDVTATDRASDDIRKVKADVADLEGEHTVTVDADDQASDDLAKVDQAADDLDGRTATVNVRADVDEAKRLLDQAEAAIRELDGRTANVNVRADVDEAKRLLDQVDSKLRELDGRSSRVSVAGAAAAGGAAGAVAGQGIPVVEDIVRGATSASEFVIQVEQLARTTGATREEAGRLARVWQDAGLDLTDLLDLMANLQSVIRDRPNLREKLNLSLANDGVTTFLHTVKNLQTEFDTAGERSQAAAKLFGEEGQRQVDRVLVLVRDDLQGAMDGIADTRLIDEADVDRARQINEQARQAAGYWQQAQLYALQSIGLIERYLQGAADLGDFVANQGGQFRRAIENLGGDGGTPNLGEDAVIYRNTTGYHGGDPYGLVGLSPPTGTQRHSPGPVYVTYNPPGTPSATNQQQQLQLARNGVRLS